MKFYRCAILMLATSASSFPTLQRAVAANLSSSERIEIKVDPKAIDEETKFLWARFGTFCGIAEWHPTVRSCTEGKESGTTYRTLSLEDGGKIKEKLLSAGPSSYRYAIVESPLPVKHYEAEFSVKSEKDKLEVVWSATYEAADGKADNDATTAIGGVLRDGIASIKSKIPDAVKGQ